MRMLSRTATCPQCGATATITLIEDSDPLRDSEGHEIRFECRGGRHSLDEVQKLRLWADTRGHL